MRERKIERYEVQKKDRSQGRKISGKEERKQASKKKTKIIEESEKK